MKKIQTNASLREKYRTWLELMNSETRLPIALLIEQGIELRYQQYMAEQVANNHVPVAQGHVMGSSLT